MSDLTCSPDTVFTGGWHTSDFAGGVPVTAEFAAPYFDRRALEREGWILQQPDALRGAPFSRALHPKAKKMKPNVYLVNHQGGYQNPEPPVVQVVYVPVGDEHKTFVTAAWSYDLKRWYDDDGDLRGRMCCGVLFIKSDA